MLSWSRKYGCCSGEQTKEAEVEQFYEDLQDLELTHKKDVLFIIGDWNTKVGSQEKPGVTGKFGFEVQNEAGQRLSEFCQENALVIANTFFQQHKWSVYTDWLYSLQPKMDNLYTVSKKQDRELTVAQIMNSLLPDSDLNRWKWKNH